MTVDTAPGGAEPLRATCDANILVSSLLTPDGEASAVLRASRAGRFILVSSKSILDEMIDVMMRPQLRRYHDLSLRDLAGARAELEHHAKMVPGKYVDLDMVPTDPRDNHVIACALEGGANYIVSRDTDLLDLSVKRVAGFHPLPILTPTAFLQVLALPAT